MPNEDLILKGSQDQEPSKCPKEVGLTQKVFTEKYRLLKEPKQCVERFNMFRKMIEGGRNGSAKN